MKRRFVVTSSNAPHSSVQLQLRCARFNGAVTAKRSRLCLITPLVCSIVNVICFLRKKKELRCRNVTAFEIVIDFVLFAELLSCYQFISWTARERNETDFVALSSTNRPKSAWSKMVQLTTSLMSVKLARFRQRKPPKGRLRKRL